MATLIVFEKDITAASADVNYNFAALNNDITATNTNLSSNVTSLNSSISAINTAINSGGGIPVGTIIPVGYNYKVPTGFLLCNGAAVSRTSYANLFTEIGTWFGTGDGSTTFNLPNLSDSRVLIGYTQPGSQGQQSYQSVTISMDGWTSSVDNHSHAYVAGMSGNTYTAGAGAHNHYWSGSGSASFLQGYNTLSAVYVIKY